MIIGIGIDAVQISEIERMITSEKRSVPFVTHTFSRRERQEAGKKKAEYFAARFAAKEAVFKAIAHHLPEKGFDFRCIESSHHEDGSPYIVLNRRTKALMKEAGAEELQISITTEGDYAIAFVIALAANDNVTKS